MTGKQAYTLAYMIQYALRTCAHTRRQVQRLLGCEWSTNHRMIYGFREAMTLLGRNGGDPNVQRIFSDLAEYGEVEKLYDVWYLDLLRSDACTSYLQGQTDGMLCRDYKAV